MSKPQNKIPKLSLFSISSHIADLILVHFGQEQAILERKARRIWHTFFFSIIVFAIWHLVVRVFIAPGFDDKTEFLSILRFTESILYGYLIVILFLLAYRHYLLLLLPRKHLAFSTILFFFVSGIFLFARLYYSIYSLNPDYFICSESIIKPTNELGVNGVQDLKAFSEFVLYSGYNMLNNTSSRMASNSLLISIISYIQLIAGYLLIILVVATFVQISSTIDLDKIDKQKEIK